MSFFKKRTSPPRTMRAVTASRETKPLPDPNLSVIGGNTRFRGEIRGRGPLTVRGQVEGTVGIDGSLTLVRGGHLVADTRAKEVLISGTVTGNVKARKRLVVRSGGTIEGQIEAGLLRVEEGAILRGTVARTKRDS